MFVSVEKLDVLEITGFAFFLNNNNFNIVDKF